MKKLKFENRAKFWLKDTYISLQLLTVMKKM